jgi:hypothetical protein
MRTRTLVVMTLAWLAIGVVTVAYAQHQHGGQTPSPAPTTAPAAKKAPLRVTEEQLHQGPGGVPPGWRFSWPDGDAKKGRDVFAKLECYQCHEVPGESFPAVTPDPTRRGPELGGMGEMHPAEYFAESILNPNAVIVTGPGFTGPDGLSIMPDFRDSLTLTETVDLVAYIRSLTGGMHQGHHAAAAPREQVTRDYRVRVAYAVPGAHEHGQAQHGGHQHGAAPAPAAHLMVFVTDAVTGEPVPYLPVSATIQAEKTAARMVKLAPMLGDRGFHYGSNVTLPGSTSKITVVIGKPTIAVMPSPGGRPRAATSVTFEWSQ